MYTLSVRGPRVSPFFLSSFRIRCLFAEVGLLKSFRPRGPVRTERQAEKKMRDNDGDGGGGDHAAGSISCLVVRVLLY